jgi:DNA-binding transcriptional LysR family regulator
VAGGRELDWDDLRYFLEVTRAKSLAGAARALRVEHSTVGRRLSALEAALGIALVSRGANGLRLTRLGESLAPLVENVERAVVAARALAEGEKARVKLAVPSGFMRVFSGALGELRRAHPELSLEIVSGARPVDLERGEADLAIRSRTVVGDDLVARRLCTTGWSVYASQAYLDRHRGRFDLEDLTGHEVIGFDVALAGSPGARWIEARASQVTISMRSREMTDVVGAAASGVGLAVVPCLVGDAEPKLQRLTPAVVATHELVLVYRREGRLSASIRAVARFVADTVVRNAPLITGEGTPASAPAPGSRTRRSRP